MIQPLLIPTAAEKRIDTDFYVEGYATTFDKPYLLYEWDGNKYYERIDRNALAGADMSDVIMQYNHEGKVLARLSNGTLGVEANDNGLFTFADLSKSRAAQDMFEEIKNGLVTKMSWAFRVSEDSYDRDTRTRTILKIAKVYDVSAVSIPANADTLLHVKGAVKFAIEGTNNAAAIHTENASITAAADTLTTVSLSGYEIVKLVQISDTVMTMSITAFESWIVNMLAEAIARKVEDLLINGTGSSQPKGIENANTWGATNSVTVAKTGALTAANVQTLIGLLPSGYDRNGKFVMNKKWIKQSNTSGGGGFPAASSLQRRVQQ